MKACKNKAIANIYILLMAVILIIVVGALLSHPNPLKSVSRIINANSDVSNKEKCEAFEKLNKYLNADNAGGLQKKVSEIINKIPNNEDENVVKIVVDISQKIKGIGCERFLTRTITDNNYSEELKLNALRLLLKSSELRDSYISNKMANIIKNNKRQLDLRKKIIDSANKYWNGEILDALLVVAKDKNDSINLRLAAINKLGEKLVMGSSAMDDILSLYLDRNKSITKAAQKVLQKARNRTSIFSFYGYGTAVGNAMGGVSKIQALNASHQQQLMALMDDGEKEKKKTAVERIAEKLNDSATSVRVAAVYDLGQLNDRAAIPFLNKLAEHETKGRVQVMLAKVFVKLHNKNTIKSLSILIKNARKRAKPECIKAFEIIAKKKWSASIVGIKKKYVVKKASVRPQLKGLWNNKPWVDANVGVIDNFASKSSSHHPITEFKLLYDDDNIYLHFQVHDKYIIAKTKDFQGLVYQDSCVEFFVKPSIGNGYFNFEVNCGGNVLCSYIIDRSYAVNGVKRRTKLSKSWLRQLNVFHTMPKVVLEEIKKETIWRIEYVIPKKLLEFYIKEKIGDFSGQEWTANFYKCADGSSHPHWGMWKDCTPPLNFHQPEKFGKLIFENSDKG